MGREAMTGENPSATPKVSKNLRAVPRGVWVLGFVSLFMDASSEIVHSLLPVFMVSVLGASALAVGLLEGVAEATTSIVKVFSGALSDRLGRRKALTVLGYGVAALTKPMFPLAPTLGWVFAARFIDRVGKGIRGAPRDALIADLTPPPLYGAAYGLRQSLDTVGAFVGPLLAILLMILFAGDIRAVFWVAVVPAIIAVALLVVGVREPERPASTPSAAPLRRVDLARLGRGFWWVVGIGTVLTLARFSEAFLVLRIENLGLSATFIPLVLIVMSVVYAAAAYPAGRLSDRIDRRIVLGVGFTALIAADLVLAFAGGVATGLIGVALWGLHMGLTQGLLAALVADSAPADRRGTAFGVFNLVSGAVLLAASVLAGGLWDRFGAPATFLAGAGFTTIALIGLIVLMRREGRRNESPS